MNINYNYFKALPILFSLLLWLNAMTYKNLCSNPACGLDVMLYKFSSVIIFLQIFMSPVLIYIIYLNLYLYNRHIIKLNLLNTIIFFLLFLTWRVIGSRSYISYTNIEYMDVDYLNKLSVAISFRLACILVILIPLIVGYLYSENLTSFRKRVGVSLAPASYIFLVILSIFESINMMFDGSEIISIRYLINRFDFIKSDSIGVVLGGFMFLFKEFMLYAIIVTCIACVLTVFVSLGLIIRRYVKKHS